jgi:hypothetical protein
LRIHRVDVESVVPLVLKRLEPPNEISSDADDDDYVGGERVQK